MQVRTDAVSPAITFLSWDTEGGDRAGLNLLRRDSPVALQVRIDGQWLSGEQLATDVERGDDWTSYHTSPAPEVEVVWQIINDPDRLAMRVHCNGASRIEALALTFPFDPRVTATTVLPASWGEDGSFALPAVVSAPDFGQTLLSTSARVRGRLVGSRENHIVDMTLELPAGEPTTIIWTPVVLPEPDGLRASGMWVAGRRGWFNVFQPTAEWGDQGNPFSAPAGILANNVVSDAVSCLLSMWADQAFLTPDFSRDIRVIDLVRRTVDWWLTKRTRPTGEVVAYWDYVDMLDANCGPIIASWDYVEATGDLSWLAERVERLELVADYLIERDIDDDGLIESTHTGNYGTLKHPQRADSAYDTINAGHKNAYCNTLAYRAFRCLADLEKQLGRPDQSARYARRADRLRAQFLPTFYNPGTGWLAWWQSEDGEVHDLSSPMVTSLAICCGLVSPEQGRPMMRKLWEKVGEVGFRRFDLGLPITLTPVRPGDYLIGEDIPGAPSKDDGSDTFGQYLNGGCMVSDAVYFITAMHIVGDGDKGDQILSAMLARQRRGVFPNGGGFQNGVINHYPYGAEFYTWEGETTGYEGHLTYSFTFLQAILLRQPEFRERLFRPLMEER